MPDALETLEVSSMLANAYEPKRKFRFILEIDGIDAFTVESTARPHLSFDTVEIHYINARRYLAGKMAWATIGLTLNDPIAPSAAQKVMQWVNLAYEAITGRAGYASFYKKDIVLKMLDPIGDVVERWTLKGTWITDADFTDLNYTTSDVAQVTLTLQYDNAVLEY